MNTDIENLFKDKVLGHPAGLFLLFFTEMWERFSFYGMRVLLINFLTMSIIGYNPGWEWSAENAAALFGTYAMLLYLTPIAGGIIADKLIGYRWAVVVGAIIMTLGHAAMAIETEFWLYVGLGLLVIGTGFFKPNITSIISEMYKNFPDKKDGAYTIFYMGVNAGAFFGMMLCGYLAERVGWSWGFGLAGIFMLLGTLQFWLAKPLFGKIGDIPVKSTEKQNLVKETKQKIDNHNPFSNLDVVLIIISSLIGLAYAINHPLSKIAGIDLFSFFEIGKIEGQYVVVLFGLVSFLFLVINRISRYTKVVRDRMIAVIIFAFFTVFFWMSFEQGASSLVLFARDNVQRELLGNSAIFFNIFNALLTIIPLCFVSYVLYLLAKKTFKKISFSNIVLFSCFVAIWCIVGWMLNRDFNTVAYELSYKAEKIPVIDSKTNNQKKAENGTLLWTYKPITQDINIDKIINPIVEKTTILGEGDYKFIEGQKIQILTKNNDNSSFGYLDSKKLKWAKEKGNYHKLDNGIVQATVKKVKSNWVEITVSWFSILNSFFIIALAGMFSKWWDSKYNPSAAVKYGLGLIIMAIGFGLLALGSYGLEQGVKVSLIWLVLAYLFHTMGELCLSPVGLSYVSKLVPARMIAFMFGMWYLAIAIGNKLAAILGGEIENITKEYSLSTFFLIFTIVPILAGIFIIGLNPILKKLMHGVK